MHLVCIHQFLFISKFFFVLAMFSAIGAESAEFSLNAEDYKAAASLDTPKLSALVRNAEIKVNWIDKTDYFWYQRDTNTDSTLVIIDAKTGLRSNVYDVSVMANALRKYVVKDAKQIAAAPLALTAKRGQMEAEFDIDGQLYICRLDKPKCKQTKNNKVPANFLPAPNGEMAVFVRNHNLWLRNLNTAKETNLTQDGVTYASYADTGSYSKLAQIRSGISITSPPIHTHWSPDSRWLITRYLDEREVEPYVFLESVRSDGGFRPKTHEVPRYSVIQNYRKLSILS